MQREKVRVYALARELNMESKDLLDLCRQAGFDVKNQLSSLDPEQRDAVELMVRKGGAGGVAVAAPPRSAPASHVLAGPIKNLSARPVRREAEPSRPVPAAAPPSPVVSSEPPAVAAELASSIKESAVKTHDTAPVAPAEAVPGPSLETPILPSPDTKVTTAGESGVKAPPPLAAKMRDLNQPRPDSGPRARRQREIPRPIVARAVPPPTLKPRPGGEHKKPAEPAAQKPLMRLTPEDLRKGQISAQDMVNKAAQVEAPAPAADLDDEEGGDQGSKSRPGAVTGRDKRHQQRNERAKARKTTVEVAGKRVLLPVDDDTPQRMRRAGGGSLKLKKRQITQPRKGKVPVMAPITVRSLSEAIGIRSGELLFKLRDHGASATLSINSTLDSVMAETVALEFGCELDVKRPVNQEELLLADLGLVDPPEDLQPRAPVVTIMGHVDHGKTTLLDKIRVTNIAATEAGGITQVIRAWRVEHGGRPVTFLDTPGHQAFTKMRARGAQVTDIAVIVVAADDGVMPQTEEAVNHARAAGVPIVVAINKVDLPNANVNKTRQQLYGLQLIPDTMGGDTPFVETSAATGKGVGELLDMLSLVAELKELKANPSRPGQGVCLEANLSEGEGVQATLLVQAGTLRRGDAIVCGATFGRVRALYDDLGRPIAEAGPSVPVRITGLDVVPNADDPFTVAPDIGVARAIADKRRTRLIEASIVKREPAKLENLSQAKIAELKVILKADFRGSVEAIRKELEKLRHDEVRVRILEAGIGAITENDVWLALASPEDTIIVGFNVVPDDRARAVAEERGIQIREYDIIYQLTDDIRSALEGKLKPREDIVHLGRAVVRETFKISRTGTIAGCYVTQGVIERSAKVRVIREGVVIYPPAERTAALDSLKHFKEDRREIREGFECGLKIAGYDDIKVGDVIEAYRVEQVKRTLS